MELTTKGLIGASLLVATAVPATVFISSSDNKFPKKPSQFKPKTLTDYRDETNKGRYLYYFPKLFVDSVNNNKEFWDKSFSRLQEDKKNQPNNISTNFNAVTSALGEGINLSSRCSSYYNDTYLNSNGSEDTVGQVIKDFWKYCTIIEKELELVTTSSEGQNKIQTKYKNILISAEENKNKEFWDIQNEDFFDAKGLGTLATEGSSFHTQYTNKTQSPKKTLRELCLEAYKKEANGKEEEKDTLLFCSISVKKLS